MLSLGNGRVWESEFKTARAGDGQLQWPNGFVRRRVREQHDAGVGTFTWANKDRYRGAFVIINITGNGYMSWHTGQSYEGGFQNGLMHGRVFIPTLMAANIWVTSPWVRKMALVTSVGQTVIATRDRLLMDSVRVMVFFLARWHRLSGSSSKQAAWLRCQKTANDLGTAALAGWRNPAGGAWGQRTLRLSIWGALGCFGVLHQWFGPWPRVASVWLETLW